ncbi:hypothetical protein [Arthrobacter sp. A2-55]|uniref:hypothetical protein n=1 Tax=Arthrobacter sp. A2-55 TaxID=2897337 RepID=UPI0021CD49DB|nr:hypothetical protein [Arthrobacter sp. A2-55]MCU6479639.1 hypothetical protein [Arthrobacter sp. A2-55]
MFLPVALPGIGLIFRVDLAGRSGRNPAGTIRPGKVGSGGGPAMGGSGAASGRPAPDHAFLAASSAVLAVLLPVLVSGIQLWIPSTAAAVELAALFAVGCRQALTMALLPWPLLVLASGLFPAMEAVRGLGTSLILGQPAGQCNGLWDLLRLAATGAVGANIKVNNLPAYLLIELAAGTPQRLAALLIGVNTGALVTPWASPATLLWHGRHKRMNVVAPGKCTCCARLWQLH